MKIVNLTPHPLDVQRTDGTWVNIPPSGQVARVAERRTAGPVVDSAEFGEFATEWFSLGDVEDMPTPEPGTVYVVSKLVAQALGNRLDVVCPGEVMRDNQGRIVGCVGFSRWLER